MNYSSSSNKQLKPENSQGTRVTRFLVSGLQYELTPNLINVTLLTSI